MLGYSFPEGYSGRGVIEAVGAGVKFADGELALRANFATVESGVIVDRRAGRNLTKEEGARLVAELESIELRGAQFEFKHTVSHRAVLVMRAEIPLSAKISNTDPAYTRVKGFGAARRTSGKESVMSSRPLATSKAARIAAKLVNEFTRKSMEILSRSRVNKSRMKQGKKPANAVLLRDAGDHLPRVTSFREQYDMEGVAIVEMPAEVGIARILKMKEIRIEDPDDLSRKAKIFCDTLEEGVIVYAHIKGPDEFGHDGDVLGKKKSIERIDREFFSAAKNMMTDTKIVVSCDHATPCVLKTHSSDVVPLLITDGGKDRDCCRFTESDARRGSIGSIMGAEVLRKALGS
jgi:2,3-bisphosphoglycerate-independent phosphoglycerate mutase